MLRVHALTLSNTMTPEEAEVIAGGVSLYSLLPKPVDPLLTEMLFVTLELQLAFDIAHKEDYPELTESEFCNTKAGMLLRNANSHNIEAALDSVCDGASNH